MTSNAEHTAIPHETAGLIARARAALAEDAYGSDLFGRAERIGALKWLVEELCIDLEDAADPDGRARRMIARLNVLGARFDALRAGAGERR